MIHTNRTVTVGEQESKIDSPIVLYRGDREVEIEFTLVGNRFTFSEKGNVIKSVNASHGQLVLNTPSGEHMFSELAECHEGKVVFVVTKEMIDEFIEMGFYSFQIRLYDSAEMKSRVTIPPVMNGFDIRNPIAAEDETNVVDQGIVDYARIFKDQSNEELPTFDWQGNYNKTEWAHHDVITENKMNKIEDALYSINANVKESDVVMLNTLDQVKKDADKYVKKHMAEVEQDVEEFERNLNTDVQQFKIDTNAAMTAHKNEVSEELESINSQLAHSTNNETMSRVSSKDRKTDGSMVVFWSDDGRNQDYTVVKDIFARNNKAPFVTAMVTGLVGGGGYCTLEQLKDLQDNYNWEIVSHTHTHRNLTELTDAEVDEEFKLSYNWLKNNSFKNFNTCAIPYNFWGDREKLIGSKYYRAIRVSNGSLNTTPIETYEMKTIWFEFTDVVNQKSGYTPKQFEHYKYWIDQAVSQNALLILSTHSWEIEEWEYQSLLERVLQYAQQVSEVVKFSEALDRIENVVDCGLYKKSLEYSPHFVLSADGLVDSNQMITVKLETDAVDINTTLDKFKTNTVSSCSIRSNKVGFPSDLAGLLLTYRFAPGLGDHGYSYQLYHPYATSNIYFRTARDTNKWGGFISLIDAPVTKKDDATSTTLLSSFPKNNVIYSEIRTANASGFPENKAGTLTTYRFDIYDSYLFSYQTYKPINSSRLYIRNVNSDGSWDNWTSDLDNAHFEIKGLNVYNGLSLPNEFPKSKVTASTINTATADSGLPQKIGGTLTTYIISTDYGYNYQTFKKYGTTDTWTRSATSPTTWGTWSKITVV